MKFKDFYLIVGTVCWLISLTSILFNRPKYLKLFSIFIFISISIEWYAWHLARHLHSNNLWLYNIYTLFEFIFLPLFYSFIIESKKIKYFVQYFIFIYPFLFFINIFWIQGFYTFNTYSYVLGSTIVLFLIIIFFREILFSNNKMVLSREPTFYISSAFFLFFLIEIPYTILLPYFATHANTVSMALIWILKILNILLYILLSIAFLCKPKNQI